MKITLTIAVFYLFIVSLSASIKKEVDSCYYINRAQDTIWKYAGDHLYFKHPHQIQVFDSKERATKQRISADSILGFGRYEKTKQGKRLIHYRTLSVPYKQWMCKHLQEVLYDSSGVLIVTDWKCLGNRDILVSRFYYQNEYKYTIDKKNWSIIRSTYFPGRVFPFKDKKAGAYTFRKYFLGR